VLTRNAHWSERNIDGSVRLLSRMTRPSAHQEEKDEGSLFVDENCDDWRTLGVTGGETSESGSVLTLQEIMNIIEEEESRLHQDICLNESNVPKEERCFFFGRGQRIYEVPQDLSKFFGWRNVLGLYSRAKTQNLLGFHLESLLPVCDLCQDEGDSCE
jgi:hypothetical protein